ncbi:hypothetical protein GCM10023144_26050 [Pigmentiphaga soli]|uniref:DUF904 domain-containing protein n=1 Tax=Pigmentiphaga soli TaxID=1007095 RepID=A0ABP8H472_9BURK
MIEDLDHLAQRLRQLARLTQDLRAENRALQGEIGRRDAQIRSLHGTLETAQSRVDAVLARLPVPPSEAAQEDDAQADDPASEAEDENAIAAPHPAADERRSMHGTT